MLNTLWGKLGAEILMQNWEVALEEIAKLAEHIDNQSVRFCPQCLIVHGTAQKRRCVWSFCLSLAAILEVGTVNIYVGCLLPLKVRCSCKASLKQLWYLFTYVWSSWHLFCIVSPASNTSVGTS